MGSPAVEFLMEQIRHLSNDEKRDLIKALIYDNRLELGDAFSSQEIEEIRLAADDVQKGLWVDLDDHRRQSGL